MSGSGVPEPAGLIARCSAAVLDGALVFALTSAVVGLGRIGDRYIPFEFTLLLAWVAQAVLAAICKRRTPGKWLLGLAVRRVHGGTPGVLRLAIREAARLAALLPLGMGVWGIGLSRTKRGWHDYLSGTRVVQEPATASRRRRAARMVALGLVILFGWLAAPRARLYVRAARMIPPAATTPTGLLPPRDIRVVAPAEHTALARWLDVCGLPPEEYAVAIAARHQLTIFGEFHHVADNLRFLIRILPDLYHRAGVRCLAMEALVWEDDADLLRLVTSAEFDRRQAVTLARHQGWKSWGSREYIDVLEEVWRLNRSLPAGQPPLRVIGLDREWDMPSWALVGLGDDTQAGPWWERLRLLRVSLDLPLMARRDELMAWRLEREVFATGQRAVAWAGAAHGYTDYARPLVFGDSTSARRRRMGAILRSRYGQQVCHLRLHDSASEGPALAALIEAVQADRGHAPVAFDLAGSPFADLRDEGGQEYRRDPKARFCDFATGYLYLAPLHAQRHCAWESDFITRSMFLRDKPYYEAYTGRRLRDAQEAD
ncbi:MAG: RDD family protein, partial [Phycisphaerales bacterium]